MINKVPLNSFWFYYNNFRVTTTTTTKNGASNSWLCYTFSEDDDSNNNNGGWWYRALSRLYNVSALLLHIHSHQLRKCIQKQFNEKIKIKNRDNNHKVGLFIEIMFLFPVMWMEPFFNWFYSSNHTHMYSWDVLMMARKLKLKKNLTIVRYMLFRLEN